MIPILVGKNESRMSRNPEEALAAQGVDDEIVITLYDAERGVGGLLRFTEPDSRVDTARARKSPSQYADTGISSLLEEICRHGGEKTRVAVHIVGGAQSSTPQSVGKKNYLAARKNLWKIGVAVQSEQVGGTHVRNVRLEIASGRFWITEANSVARELGQDCETKEPSLWLTVS